MQLKNDFVVCFDVSGTLLDVDGKPSKAIIELLKVFVKLRCQVYIWSGAGMSVVRRLIIQLGLDGKVNVCEKGSIKPDLCIDDEFVQHGKANLRVPVWVHLDDELEKV